MSMKINLDLHPVSKYDNAKEQPPTKQEENNLKNKGEIQIFQSGVVNSQS